MGSTVSGWKTRAVPPPANDPSVTIGLCLECLGSQNTQDHSGFSAAPIHRGNTGLKKKMKKKVSKKVVSPLALLSTDTSQVAHDTKTMTDHFTFQLHNFLLNINNN